MATRTGYVGTEITGDTLTVANFNKLPGGCIGYASATGNQTGITTAVDLTGLTLSVTPSASRILRVTCAATISLTSASSQDIFNVTLLKDGTVIGGSYGASPSANTYENFAAWTFDVGPTVAAHTYKVQGGRSSGTGTYALIASPTQPAWIAVFDDGPSF